MSTESVQSTPAAEETKKLLSEVIPENPTKLEDFGYCYDEHGKLKNIENGEGFKFVNQAHYEALGDFVTLHIQKLLRDFGLEEIHLPLDAKDDEPTTNIFRSKDALTAETLLLVIQGSGAVRPGMWARALCINDSLESGTIFPYLERAVQERKWGVIVFNPNQNYKKVDGDERKKEIRGSECPEGHVAYVWEQFVRKAAAKDVLIVAHSYGGVCTVNLVNEMEKEVLERVRAIALTDSVHFHTEKLSEMARRFFAEKATNWVTSDKPLDTPIAELRNGCRAVSAGHKKHEWTSHSARESVFKYFDASL